MVSLGVNIAFIRNNFECRDMFSQNVNKHQKKLKRKSENNPDAKEREI